ncbi:MAG: SDR family oxidoreductase [Gammaproteobacteria bacterium]|nr:SDR family oxidoreductase [Gammaproteobacteria bacterium]
MRDKLFDIHSLKNCNAVVTGGSRGIGRAAALSLATLGANVAISSSQSDLEAKEVGREIEALGVKCATFLCDVSEPSAVQDMFYQVKEQWGSIDVLVNNAGIAQVARAEDMTLEQWKRVIDVNLTGTFLCCQAAGKDMIQQGKGGSIINVASICASIAVKPDHHCHYDAAKGGVVMLTKTLAAEWAKHNIRVNVVSPGYIKTRMTDSPLYRPIWAELTALGRMGEPEEIGGMIAFLATKHAAFMTGSEIVIDGGYTAIK